MHSTCADLEGEWGTNFINLHSKITEICLGKIKYPSDPQPPPPKNIFWSAHAQKCIPYPFQVFKMQYVYVVIFRNRFFKIFFVRKPSSVWRFS